MASILAALRLNIKRVRLDYLPMTDKELKACTPIAVNLDYFNLSCTLPYGLEIHHIYQSMNEFINFLGFINTQLKNKNMSRLESFLMPANFSSIVGEFMNMSIPKYCITLAKNQYPNGHPDLIPVNTFSENAVQYSNQGIEVKGSRHLSGWQGHNPESVWLMVFCFDSNTSIDSLKQIDPKPFIFRAVYAAKLEEEDWNFSGRSSTSRRTITASVNRNGFRKMKNNWVYQNPSISRQS
ncbi:MAG: hypothetical protein LRZ84_04595 [Desertifilum sp.]|nr:hypothetical protein [Desertifilum sp.]